MDAVRQRVEEVADAQQQALATASHNKTVLDGVSKDFYKLLLEQIAWIMVELKVAKADRAAVAADAATSISSSNGAHHHHGNVSDEPNNSRAASRSSALLPTRNNGTTSSSGGGNLSVRAVQSIEAKLDNVQTAHEKLARTQQSHHRRLLDAVAGLADSGNMKIMTSELMSNLIAQIEDVSKTVRRLGNGQGGSTSRGRVSDARAAEVKAKDALEETKRLVSSFNEHIVRQHQDIKREIKANRWTMEATAKSFEKALTFHLGIIHESGVSLAASGGAIEANEPTFSPTGSGHGTPRGATNSRGVFGQPVASDAAESSNAARHALLFGNAGSSSPSRRRSHSPVDLAIAAGGIDDMASEHSEPGQEHHDDVLDNGAAKGYRYEPPQLRNPKPSTGIGHAQAKVLQASVLKSTSYLQRLEEVTEERYVACFCRRVYLIASSVERCVGCGVRVGMLIHSWSFPHDVRSTCGLLAFCCQTFRVKMLDRGEFVTETTFDKRMQQMLDRLENLEKAVIANIETQTQVSANVRTRARAPQHSRRTAPGTGRSRTPQPQQSDDDFNSPRAADAHAIREQKTQQDSHERTAQQESKMQDPQHAAEPFVPSAAMESVAAAAAAAADTASSAASKAARAADEASSATTEGISAALAAAAAAREASAAAASAAEAAQASASAVRDLSQRIHALANSVASIGRNQDGVQKMLSDTLRAVTRL